MTDFGKDTLQQTNRNFCHLWPYDEAARPFNDAEEQSLTDARRDVPALDNHPFFADVRTGVQLDEATVDLEHVHIGIR